MNATERQLHLGTLAIVYRNVCAAKSANFSLYRRSFRILSPSPNLVNRAKRKVSNITEGKSFTSFDSLFESGFLVTQSKLDIEFYSNVMRLKWLSDLVMIYSSFELLLVCLSLLRHVRRAW